MSKLLLMSKYSDEQQTDIKPGIQNNHIHDKEHNGRDQKRFYENNIAGSRFGLFINDAYEKIVQWKRNVFMLNSNLGGRGG